MRILCDMRVRCYDELMAGTQQDPDESSVSLRNLYRRDVMDGLDRDGMAKQAHPRANSSPRNVLLPVQ